MLPSSSVLINLVILVSGIAGRRECVTYVVVLDTIGSG